MLIARQAARQVLLGRMAGRSVPTALLAIWLGLGVTFPMRLWVSDATSPAPVVTGSSPTPMLSLSVTPGRATVGSFLTVTGNGFTTCPDYGNHAYNILWDGTQVSGPTAIPTSGTFTAVIKVPTGAAAGSHWVYGQCVDSGEWARDSVTVIDPHPQLAVTSPGVGRPGDRLTLSGVEFDQCRGYGEGADTVQLLWDGAPAGTAPVASDGTVTGTVTVPNSAPDGVHTVTATCGTPSAATSVTVARPHPVITTSPQRGYRKDLLQVTGTGFGECTTSTGAGMARLTWEGAPLATVPVTAAGLTSKVAIPPTASDGSHSLTATCTTNHQISASTAITVLPSPETSGAVTSTSTTETSAKATTTVTVRPTTVPGSGAGHQSVTSAASTGTTHASPTASPTGAPGGTSADPGQIGPRSQQGGGWPRPRFVQALHRFGDVHYSLVGTTALLLILLGLSWVLIGWPAETFNSTWEENEALIRRWLRIGAARLTRRKVSWPLVVGFSMLGAALITLSSPEPDGRRAVFVQWVGMAIAIPVVTLTYEHVVESRLRTHPKAGQAPLRVMFMGLAVAAACAAVSRLLNLQPPYAYGLILSYAMAGRPELPTAFRARAVLRGAIAVFLLTLSAWSLWQFGTATSAAANTVPFGLRLIDTILGNVAALGAETLMFALLPLRFLRGNDLWAWNKWVWSAVYALAVLSFTTILLGNASIDHPKDVVRSLLAFATFALGSLTFWGAFVMIRPPHQPSP